MRPTGRVYVPERTDVQREQALQALHEKYGAVSYGGGSSRRGEQQGGR